MSTVCKIGKKLTYLYAYGPIKLKSHICIFLNKFLSVNKHIILIKNEIYSSHVGMPLFLLFIKIRN